MPKIDIAKAVVRTKGVYPQPYNSVTDGREKAALGNVAGLTQFGVNLTRLKPGAASALRHWHEQEDEFVYALEGELARDDWFVLPASAELIFRKDTGGMWEELVRKARGRVAMR